MKEKILILGGNGFIGRHLISRLSNRDYECFSLSLKKGNKEFVVAKGEKLEGIYELVEVNKDEVIFRNQEKLYKIENLVGNNL